MGCAHRLVSRAPADQSVHAKTYLERAVQPADLYAPDLREPPAPDVLCALCDLLPARRKVVEAHREALLLELERALDAHADTDDDADDAEAAQRGVEVV